MTLQFIIESAINFNFFIVVLFIKPKNYSDRDQGNSENLNIIPMAYLLFNSQSSNKASNKV